MVEQGEFREDLYYRLNIVPILIPPLRDRKGDIRLLTDFFLNHQAKTYGFEIPKLSIPVQRALENYSWPGNVRELSNKIERFVLLGDELELLKGLHKPVSQKRDHLFKLPPSGLDWEEFEKNCLAQALERCAGNRTQAAKLLNLSYKAFLYRLEKFGLV
jgi:transcriptional regulator with PAS, ATPase and Fis domain